MKLRRRHRERGAAAVEMALLLPVLLLIIAAIVDLGRLFYVQNITTNAAREGVRLVTLGYPAVPDANNRISQAMIAYQGTGYTVKTEYFANSNASTTPTSSCTWTSGSPGCASTIKCPNNALPGDRMRITVTVNGFRYMILGAASRFFGGAIIPPNPNSLAEMRCQT